MSLEERTLVVRGIDDRHVTHHLLRELFNNFGPVVKIVMRADHAFIEYKDRESVAYSFAMVEGLEMNKCTLRCSPRIDNDFYYRFKDKLQKFDDSISVEKYQNRFLDSKHKSIVKKERSLAKDPAKIKDLVSRSKLYSRHYPLLRAHRNPYLNVNIFQCDDYRGSRSNSRDHRRSDSASGSRRESYPPRDARAGAGGWQSGAPRPHEQYERNYQDYGYPAPHGGGHNGGHYGPPPPAYGYPPQAPPPAYQGYAYGMPYQEHGPPAYGQPPPPPRHYHDRRYR